MKGKWPVPRSLGIESLRSQTTALVHDLLMVPIAWLGAFWLRFNLESVPTQYWLDALLLLPIVWISQGAACWYFGLYRGIWRFASIPDLIRIIKAVTFGVAIAAALIFGLTRLEGVPRSVFLLDAVLLVALLAGPRLLYRWLKDRHLYIADGKRAIVVGAGQAGEMLVRDMLRDGTSPFRPVLVVDDNLRKHGRELHGLRVRGPCDQIPALAEQYGAEIVLIAVPSARSAELRRIVDICERAGLAVRTLPPLQDLVSGKVGIRQLRTVTIDDLLGREKVELDWHAITAGLTDRVVLVTGGGGSIGSELCRQLARITPAKLVVFERNEFALYKIDLELRRVFPKLTLESVLGDVSDRVGVDAVMRKHRPSVVFHAAAYKHVPLLEHQARPAVLNNVVGTQVVADSADAHNVETFVLISSDKAVNPANVMGATKRIAELYCQHVATRSKTSFVTVRFGNVLGSAGSVLPLFQEQIENGGPVTVTHPEITRYFMTIPEAGQLILEAGVVGGSGEIFVLDMGEPIKIAYLAERLALLSGKKPGEDIEIIYTGVRPGEKLVEELFHSGERLRPTGHAKLLLAEGYPVNGPELVSGLATLWGFTQAGDEEQTRATLLALAERCIVQSADNSDNLKTA
jgi:FlaA1/EpsC-like NDP-sugar epimerase